MAEPGPSTSVQFTTPGTPAPSGPLAITTVQSLKQNSQGSGLDPFANCPSSCDWADTRTSSRAPGDEGFDIGYDSMQGWGSAGLKDPDFLQAYAGVRPAADGRPAEPGQPFLFGDFEHINEPIRGDSPTVLGIQTLLTVQPPAGPAAVFNMRGSNTVPLDFPATDNTPPCDPSIQVSSTPCDDLWSIGDVTSSTVAGGVTWHFELLGWQAPDGTFQKSFVTEEGRVSTRQLYGPITVDTNTTASQLTVDGSTPAAPMLQLTTTPAPQTGGTVTFTDGGAPVAGCTDVPVGATDGITNCAPTALSAGSHTFGAQFNGGVGYASSPAAPETYLVPASSNPGTPGGGTTGGGSGKSKSHAVSLTGSTTLTTTRSDIVTALLKCVGPGACTGSATLTVTADQSRTTIASTKYSIAAGKAGKIKLKLRSTGRKLLKQAHGKLKVTLKLTLNASPRKVVTKTITLKSAPSSRSRDLLIASPAALSRFIARLAGRARSAAAWSLL